MQTPPTQPRPRRSPAVAAFLSFLFPGAGQLYVGSRRAALMYGIPAIVVAGAVAFRLAAGFEHLALDLLAPQFAMTIVGLVILVGLWRIAAMADAARTAAGRERRLDRLGLGVVAGLIALIVLSHGLVAGYAYSFYSAGTAIFVGEAPSTPNPSDVAAASASPAPGSSDVPGSSDDGGLQSAPPDFTPEPTEAPSTSQRITVMLVGIDSSPGRAHALTDTILVLSVDPVDKTAVMVSVPRDISNFRLPDGRTYTGKINSLASFVRRHPGDFRKGDFDTLADAVGSIIGIPVPYYAAIDLAGFTSMIDSVGGVDIVNEQEINDPSYGGWTDKRPIGFHLSAGRHHLDGANALAYVRSRKGVGDNDFTRARRQQQLLVALKDKLTDPAMLPRLPGLLDAASKTLRTDYPAASLDDLLTLGQGIPAKSITKTVLGPPYAVNPPPDVSGGIYQLRLVADKVAALSIKLFGADSRYSK